MEKSPLLELYFFDSCPYCQKVLRVIEELDLEVTFNDIYKHPEFRDKLMKDTGRKTVPCLYIDGDPMHESSEIIDWLREHQDNLQKR